MIEISLLNLEKYIQNEQYKGYDPYDTLNSWFPFKHLDKWTPVISTQIQKRNPLNIRPLLGIKKDYNPKAFGLFLLTYVILFKKTGNLDYLEKAHYFFNWLEKNYSKGFSGYCWGYNFPWANPKHNYGPYTPSSVVTGIVCRGIYEYYKLSKNEKAKEILISAADFISNDIPVSKDEHGICYSYTPLQKDMCLNASLFAAEILARAYSVLKRDVLRENANRAVEWVIFNQKQNGMWNYSIDINTGRERHQIDFHQGYVLESIYEIQNLLNLENLRWEKALQKGIIFYKEQQFLSNGVSFWRLPKRYPIDIHNQAQGIITFSKLKKYVPNAESFAFDIAQWTIQKMQSRDGHFYYQNHKFYKNRISYMRWSNAWMFLALTYLKKGN